MCSSPKSHGSTKVLKAHYGGIMSGVDKQARVKFTELANAATDWRALAAKNSGSQKAVRK
ncbi:hypothetical protein [Psychromonas ossibalaenae]|uniref:hypothetical protein n=1 Tax=Psychromonas ossibalaenae TaxID=444922 RepID=UPI00036F0B52|nr:hypothetical protein [Psychromonas ossibalaenae]